MNALKQIREAKGLTQKDLAVRMNTTDVSISRYEKEDQRLTLPLLRQLSETLRCSIGEIAGEVPFSPEGFEQDPDPDLPTTPGMVLLPELDVRAHAGGGGLADDAAPIASWGFPPEVMRYDLRASYEDLVIMAVEGDSMEPTIRAGDRVVVNRALRSPSPPGLFVLHNGIGVVAKRIDMVPRSDPPRIVVMSDNERYRPYEATADEVNILGRIVLRLERV